MKIETKKDIISLCHSGVISQGSALAMGINPESLDQDFSDNPTGQKTNLPIEIPNTVKDIPVLQSLLILLRE